MWNPITRDPIPASLTPPQGRMGPHTEPPLLAGTLLVTEQNISKWGVAQAEDTVLFEASVGSSLCL